MPYTNVFNLCLQVNIVLFVVQSAQYLHLELVTKGKVIGL